MNPDCSNDVRRRKNIHSKSQFERRCIAGLLSLLAFLYLISESHGTLDASEASKSSLADAELAIREGNSKKAVTVLDQLAKQTNVTPSVYYLRGREQFKLGNIKASMDDFDRYIKLSPDKHSRLWERGITCYYAKRFKDGVKQFELYQTYHSEDVENAAWHFICLARAESIEKARKSLLPIRRDGRIPMMTIYDFFDGKATEADILNKVRQAPESRRDSAEFYARLYLGLYYEAAAKPDQAKRNLEVAAKLHESGGYMGDVARVHLKLLSEPK